MKTNVSPCKCTAVGYCRVHGMQMSSKELARCQSGMKWYQAYQKKKFDLLDKEVPESQRFDPTSRASVESRIGSGPGTELILMLSRRFWRRLGIKITTSCRCQIHAAVMNRQGCDCADGSITAVVRWLREEHRCQGIRVPFSHTVAIMLVRESVRRARKRKE